MSSGYTVVISHYEKPSFLKPSKHAKVVHNFINLYQVLSLHSSNVIRFVLMTASCALHTCITKV